MKFQPKLIPATLLRRYKRFLADVTLANGDTTTVHCPNTGSMTTCGAAGDTVYLSKSTNTTRKYPYTWELTQTAAGFVCINTHLANKLVLEALMMGSLEGFTEFVDIVPEATFKPGVRFDFCLILEGGRRHWIEVKNVTLLASEHVLFPDTVSVRALKHVQELQAAHAQGDLASLIFVINRPEGTAFRPADAIHPEYGIALRAAQAAGVAVAAFQTQSSPEEICIQRSFPVDLSLPGD